MDLKTAVPVWWNWTDDSVTSGISSGATVEDNRKSPAADFEGYIRQENNKIDIHQKLALKKEYMKPGIGTVSVLP